MGIQQPDPTYVTKQFRDELWELAPEFHGRENWIILSLLLFPRHIDQDFDGIVFEQAWFSSMLGKQRQYSQDNFSTIEYLEPLIDFARSRRSILKVFELHGDYNPRFKKEEYYGPDLSGPDIWKFLEAAQSGKSIWVECRFTPELNGLLSRELTSWQPAANLGNLVEFVTGKRRGQKASQQQREILQRAIDQANKDTSLNPLTQKFMDFLNDLPSHTFTKLASRNMAEALKLAAEEPSESKRRHTVYSLNKIALQPKPHYEPSSRGRTARIFPANTSMLTISGRYRRILTHGCIDCDLQNSQLTIIGWRWDIPEIREFAASGKSIWLLLQEYLGVDVTKPIKDVIKHEFLYPVIYGRSEQYALEMMIKEDPAREECWKQVVKFPLFKGLVKHRNRFRNKIKMARHYTTYLGTVIVVQEEAKRTGEKISSVLNSILARDAQDIELKIMEPIIDLAKQTNEFTIVLHQHDGMTIKVAKKGREEQVKKRIKKAVESKAREIGIDAVLTWDD